MEPLHRGFVLTDVFGNALGNSIVSNRINAEQTKQNAMLASDVLSHQRNSLLNQQLDSDLQQRAGVIGKVNKKGHPLFMLVPVKKGRPLSK
jgi:hypothetical protein